jgi:hypothetical protein
MKKSIVCASIVALAASILCNRSAAVQNGGGLAQPWSKTCNLGAIGGDGCSVTLTMTADSGLCPDNGYKYCVSVSVSCPGDPAVDCDSGAVCGVCGDSAAAVAISCDGGCYSAQPKTSKSWNDVASDCGNASARDSGHPCQ